MNVAPLLNGGTCRGERGYKPSLSTLLYPLSLYNSLPTAASHRVNIVGPGSLSQGRIERRVWFGTRPLSGGHVPALQPIGTHQDVQAGGLEQRDLVGDGEPREAGHPLGELHDLDDALGRQLTELVPQAQVQPHTLLRTGVLQHTHTHTHTHTICLM